ncbi:diacylglycerol/lipid kinase family protein [Adhaeribacter radiodurans]|uniref:Diacylglycerol kinase family lipid kinase n=1 Tax=Adhaeribacter radiodurans TaxID=2745197 RepID=A0A7L7L5X2_9BACT|nr:diacylglycerol kinase family protein [Adhaeribacter radiodurans]QMU27779.1 diacylglycerol kinase family lipid kinase [Adhaeribacter radiodurans]
MAAKTNILFILNPKSGRTSQVNVPELLSRYLDASKFTSKLVFTEYAGHATELARQAAKDGYKIVGAIGGDGTVNEVATGLLDSDAILAILPKGSGNGLARHLDIPLNLRHAIRIINEYYSSAIDTCTINDHPFFCTAGIGFDAYISSVFASSTKRGLQTYIRLVLQEFTKFKPQEAVLDFNKQLLTTQVFVVAFANATQYGNNAHIAPKADIRDGLVDVCLIRDLDFRKAIHLSLGMLTKRIAAGSSAEYFTSTHIAVTSEQPFKFHADGEYVGEATEFKVSINPLSLKVIHPKG